MNDFTGFPETTRDFYDGLELDNAKSFWEAHKQVWKDAVQGPMAALTDALAEEFGAAKVFRPYRDVRFAKDKTPGSLSRITTSPRSIATAESSLIDVRSCGLLAR